MSNEVIIELKRLSHNKALLIVEDDPSIIELLKRLLQHFFKSIHTASTVEDALEIYKKHYSQELFLVITDINLDQGSGIDLTYRLKILNKEQRVIALSALEDSNIFIESIECGIDSFLLKPIGQNKLFKTLISTLEKVNYDQELLNNRVLLEKSKEYTVELLKEQDRFLKNAIHEIHTPLAIIITNIDLLRMQGIENESLNAIEAGSRTIENSYEDMTYLMKSSRNLPQIDTINLVAFIEERRHYFECIALANELSITLLVEEENLPPLYFSKLKLSRLVDNTISNAIKYADNPSQITIIIGLKNGELFFKVHNYGTVIENKIKIFERYYRESTNKGGYGLGLNIVSQICKEENVVVEINSTLKSGTSFCYTFKNTTQSQQTYSKMSYP